ncbi:ead/Ea22-like family protein [Escherichia coli O107]|nr:ead/Ea22-like family protein [Escherichia coli O107]
MSNIDKRALRHSAESIIGILENIAGFEPSDIDGDSVELRFETEDGFDTGCDVSIVDQCQKTADVVRAMLDELERNQQYIKLRDQENEDIALTVGKLRVELEAAEKRIAELEARAFNPAILDVIAERQRQQSVEGWMPEHDDEHCNGELAMAAVCYINETGTVNRNGGKPWGWPWDASWWKPNARRRNLVKAGALILAEIERIDRAAGIGKGE